MNEELLINTVIENLISNVIDIPKNQIESIYNAWRNNEKASLILNHQGKPITTIERSAINESQQVPDNAILLGVDLPYWTGDIINANKKIMIVGIDPLRDETAFNKANADINKDVLLSTPFAYHANKKSSFRSFVNHLSSDNFIYLTDLYKTFFWTDSSKKCRSYNYYGKKDVSELDIKRMLFNEIKLIKPDIIITLGAIAYKQLTGSNLGKLTRNVKSEKRRYFEDTPVLPLMHITGSYANNIKAFLKINEVDSESDYGNGFSKLVKQYLNQEHEHI